MGYEILDLGGAEPPHAIEAERSLVGMILQSQSPEVVERVRAAVPVEALWDGRLRSFYQGMCALADEGRTIDLTNLAVWLREQHLVSGKDGAMGELLDLLPERAGFPPVPVEELGAKIVEKYRRRQMVRAAEEMARAALDQRTPLGLVQADAIARIGGVEVAQGKASGLEHVEIPLLGVFDCVDEEDPADAPTPTGFYDLDELLPRGGIGRTDLVLVAGRPSMGKTAFALGVSKAMTAAGAVAVFSLEMSKEQLTYRLLSSEAGIESERIQEARLAEREWATLGAAIANLALCPIEIDDSGTITLSSIQSRSRELAKRGPLGAIVVDYLQLMGDGGGNRVQELSHITRSLKGLARELNAPVICLSQLNRSVEGRTDKRPVMSDLRETGSLEQDADIITMLFRPEYYDPDTPDRGIAEVIVRKNRNGPLGTAKLLFEPQYTRFRSLARSAQARSQWEAE